MGGEFKGVFVFVVRLLDGTTDVEENIDVDIGGTEGGVGELHFEFDGVGGVAAHVTFDRNGRIRSDGSIGAVFRGSSCNDTLVVAIVTVAVVVVPGADLRW